MIAEMELEGKGMTGSCVSPRALCVKEEGGCQQDGLHVASEPTVCIPELRIEVVKEEQPCEGWDRDSVSEALSSLYPDHEVKDELVLGPESLQRPSNVNASHQLAPASLALRECSVTLQRMSEDIAWLSTAPTIESDHTANENSTSLEPAIESRLDIVSPRQIRVRLERLPVHRRASTTVVEPSLPRRKIRDVINSLFEESDTDEDLTEDCGTHDTSYLSSDRDVRDGDYTEDLTEDFDTHDTTSQGSDREARVRDCSRILRDSNFENTRDRVEYPKDFCAICNRKFPSAILMKHLLYHIYVPTSADYEESGSGEQDDHDSVEDVSVDEAATSAGEDPGDGKRRTPNHKEKETYSCEVCNKKLKTLYSLHLHKRIHTGEKPYLCDICGKEFRVAIALRTHYRIHQRLKPYSCDICEKKFTQSSTLTQHKQTHTTEQPFACEICGSKFKLRVRLNIHKLIHTGEKPHECQTCGKKFRRRNGLNRHIRLVHSQPMHSCKICGNEVPKCDVKLHARYHSNNIKHRCEICEKGFKKIGSLKEHLLIHSGEKPFCCDVCNEKFRHKISLKRHAAIHTGEQRFSSDLLKIHRKKQLSCKVCKRKFTQLRTLNVHKRAHLKETTCQICNKVFSDLRKLKQHKLMHQKPHSCEICKKRFINLYILNDHKRIHSEEKPYTCDICQKNFSRSCYLYTHKQYKHFRREKGKSGEFTCEICEKVFSQYSSLRRHKNNHKNEWSCQICAKMVAKCDMKTHERFHEVDKRLSCEICQKGFLTMQNLKEHLFAHTGQKPFSCNMCPKRFVTKSLFVRHKKSHAHTRSVTDVTERDRDLELPMPSSEPRPLSPKSMFLDLIRKKSVH